MCRIRLYRVGTRFASQSTTVHQPGVHPRLLPAARLLGQQEYPTVNLRVRHRAVVRPREVYDM